MYRTLVADPPWKYSDNLPGGTRGAAKNYNCMSVEEICKFEIPKMHDDSFLFLWRTSALQQAALDVVKAWGFELKSELVWKKYTVNGERWFGMGRTTRMEHEVCLIAKRGRPQVKSHSVRSTFEAICEGHSRKPDEFYKIVERLSYGPYVELFARRRREGWVCLGDELD